MLSLFRSGWLRGFFLSFLVIGAAGLVLMDWQGVYGGRLAANDVARVGTEVLSIRDYDRLFRRVAQSQGLGVNDAYTLGLGDLVLQQELARLVLEQAARDYGIRPSRDLLMLELRKLAEQSREPGDARPLSEIVTTLLRTHGLSESELIASVRGELSSQILQTAFIKNAPAASPVLAAALQRADHQIRSFRAVTLTPDQFKTASTPTQETLQAYYQTVIGRFTTPEKRSGIIAVLDAAALKKTMSVTDAEVRDYYNAHSEGFSRPEQRLLEQATLPDERTARAVADAFATTGTLKNALASAGGRPDALMPATRFSRDDLPPTLQEAFFTPPAGELAGPVKGPFGWHLAHIVAIEAAGVLSFDQVRDAVRQKLIDDRFALLIDEKIATYDEGVEAGADFKALAQGMGMTVHPFEALDRLQAGPRLADTIGSPESAERLTRTLFEMLPGDSSPIMDVDGSHLVTLHVSEKIDPAPRPFNDVRADVLTVWQADQAQQAMTKAVQETVPFLEAEGLSMGDIAKQYGRSVESFTLDGLQELPSALAFPPQAVNTLRTMALGEVRVIDGPDRVTLIQLWDLKDASAAGTVPSQQSALDPSIMRSILLQHFERTYPITVNRAVLDQTYKPSLPEGAGS